MYLEIILKYMFLWFTHTIFYISGIVIVALHSNYIYIYLTVSSCSSHYYIWYREYLNIYGSSIRPVLDPWEVLNIYLLDE